MEEEGFMNATLGYNTSLGCNRRYKLRGVLLSVLVFLMTYNASLKTVLMAVPL